jgi:polar amino acid transport system substrate-binding protein
MRAFSLQTQRLLSCRSLLPALLLVGAFAATAARADTVRIATTEWPPYTSAALPGEGASAAVLRAAFKAMGHELQLEFLPWARAVYEGTQGKRLVGYFPAYESEERSRLGLRSARIGSSPVGFAHRAAEGPRWTTLDELSSFKIGVVRDYVNTAEFDARSRDGRLRTEAAVNDEENLRKLVGQRIDLAVIDRTVFHSLLAQHPALKSAGLQFGDRSLLEDKAFFVYFRRDAEGERWRQVLDAGLAQIDVRAVFQQALTHGKR